jgi:hypothetical protein
MATKKYIVTLEIECDPNEQVEGVRLNSPDRWIYTNLLSMGGFRVSVNTAQAYEACCNDKTEWATTPEDERYGDSFRPEWHDETCINYLPIEED